jgi:hypothetical protein
MLLSAVGSRSTTTAIRPIDWDMMKLASGGVVVSPIGFMYHFRICPQCFARVKVSKGEQQVQLSDTLMSSSVFTISFLHFFQISLLLE